MVKKFEMIQGNPLFAGISHSDFEKMLGCIDARTHSYGKGESILLAGDAVGHMGLILSGVAQIIKEDENGDASILGEVAASELFGEVFACAGIDHSPVTVRASEDTEVLFLNYRKVITTCSAACAFHSRLIENMLKIIAQKNIYINQKNDILSKRTTRDKLLAFFDTQRGTAKKFTIPFNREELASYLCVDRSAMSNELCKMRDAGLIKFKKNKFQIL
jgi:CRP-like cAMP-binding protein